MGFNAASSRSMSDIALIKEGLEEREHAPTHEGGAGYRYESCEALYHLVLSSFFSGDTFYESEGDRVARFVDLVEEVSKELPEFIPALASYARNDMHMRTSPSILVAEALQRGLPGAERAAAEVWLRGDEHLESLAYISSMDQKRTKRTIRAVAARLNRMSQRQFLRYACSSSGKAFSQKGALILAHPTPKDDVQSALFAYAVKGWKELTPEQQALLPDVAAAKSGEKDAGWEQLISREGSSKMTWEKAIPLMGYMALLRNLRNFVEHRVGMEHIQVVARKLTDPKEVARSQQLPFRFLSAYRALVPSSQVRSGWWDDKPTPELPSKAANTLAAAVKLAMDLSADNVPELPGRTLILVDVSGSMRCPVSAKSTVLYSEAAAILGGIVANRAQGELWAFGTTSAPVKVAPDEGLLELALRVSLLGDELGHGTEIGPAIIRSLGVGTKREGLKKFDRMFVFTDMQTFPDMSAGGLRYYESLTTTLHTYRRHTNPKFHAYGVNMAGYETSAFRKEGSGALTAEVSGWNEKIIDFARQIEGNDPVGHILKLWTKDAATDG